MAYKNSKAQAAINVVLAIGPKASAYTGNPIAITGTFASGAISVTAVSSVVGLFPGQPISGTGIPAGATIATVGVGTLTLSQETTAVGTAEALSVIPFVPILEVSESPVSGYKWDTEDVTNFNSGKNKEWLKTLLDSGKMAITGNRVSDDTGQGLLRAAFLDTDAYMFQLQYPISQDQETTPDTDVFAALVEQFDSTPISVGKAIKISASLQRTGPIDFTEGS